MTLHQPKPCEHLTRCGLYRYNEMSFRMWNFTENSAKIALKRASLIFRTPELEYLLLNHITLPK
jgi:hypothetical protein